MLFLVAAIMAMVVGWMTEFEAVHIVLSILMLAVAAVILVVANLRNKKIFDKERENFTKKKALEILFQSQNGRSDRVTSLRSVIPTLFA